MYYSDEVQETFKNPHDSESIRRCALSIFNDKARYKSPLLGRLARQGRPITFAGFLILILIILILPPYFSQHSEDIELSFKNHMIGFWI